MRVPSSGARPCRGPHRGDEPPITSAPLCDTCRRKVIEAIEGIPDQYIAAYLALEPGQRYDVRAESEHGRRGTAPHAPVPLDAEADALMRHILEVVLCWYGVVQHAAGLHARSRRPVTTQRVAIRYEVAVQRTTHPRLMDETERGEFTALRAVQRVEAIDRPVDAVSGVAITTACRTLATHVDTLLSLPPTAVTRMVAAARVVRTRRVPVPATGDRAPWWMTVAEPLLDGDTEGHVRAGGHAATIVEIDGVGAAHELLRLAGHARHVLGVNLGATTFDRPCNNCGEPGLVLLQGADHVTCSACGDRVEAKDWRRLELIWGRSITEVVEGA